MCNQVEAITHQLYKRNAQRVLGPAYRQLKWPTSDDIRSAKLRRQTLLKRISTKAEISYCGSKPHLGPLSAGCRECASGRWSCLFLTSACTANCFFCPQDRQSNTSGLPLAEGIHFDNPFDYSAFVKRFGFWGVSISGGEPLLEIQDTFAYLKQAKSGTGGRGYLWLYTNGDLLTRDIAHRLANIGLDEIRFNIAARGYDLKPLKIAVTAIPTVTVEIPAVPRDVKTVKQLIQPMYKMGVKHLNLHQLTTTEFNYRKYLSRLYTFLHEVSIPVLESEFAALEIMKYAVEHNIRLPINYCSSSYKRRIQESGRRRRLAEETFRPFETVSPLGYLRCFSLTGPLEKIKNAAHRLRSFSAEDKRYRLNSSSELLLHPDLIHAVPFDDDLETHLRYFIPMATDHVTSDDSANIKINDSLQIQIRRVPAARIESLSPFLVETCRSLFADYPSDKTPQVQLAERYKDCKPNSDIPRRLVRDVHQLNDILAFEYNTEGMGDIF